MNSNCSNNNLTPFKSPISSDLPPLYPADKTMPMKSKSFPSAEKPTTKEKSSNARNQLTQSQEVVISQIRSLKNRASPTVKDNLLELTNLFISSSNLEKVSKQHPLTVRGSDTLSEVYKSNFNISNVGEVYFKEGRLAANRANICYKLMVMLDMPDVVAPVKEGKATVISKEVNKHHFKKLSTETKSSILVDTKDLEYPIEIIKKLKNGKMICILDNQKFYLVPSKEKGIYKLELSPPDHYVTSGSQWMRLIDEEGNSFLTPKKEVLEINTHEKTGKQFVHAKDGNPYFLPDNHEISKTISLIPGTKKSTQEVLEQTYIKFKCEDPEESGDEDEDIIEGRLVPKEAVFPFTENFEGDEIDLICDDESFNFSCVKKDTKHFELTQPNSLELDDEVMIAEDAKHQTYLIQKSKSYAIQHDRTENFDFIERDNIKLVVTENKKGIRLAKETPGMIQAAIEKTFTGYTPSKPLDLRTHTATNEHTKKFFNRIDKHSFIKCFLAIMLLRSEAKAVDLTDSNILFEALPNENKVRDPLNPSCKLACRLIDYDDSFPRKNDYSEDSARTEGKEHVHAVRNGLMGFPQSYELSDTYKEDQKYMCDLLENTVNSSENIHALLQENKTADDIFTDKHIEATMEIVEKMNKFLKDPSSPKNSNEKWTLQDLFFYVFPEYKEQWDLLGNEPPVNKAMFIGEESIESMKSGNFGKRVSPNILSHEKL